jgi:hypothetical protein
MLYEIVDDKKVVKDGLVKHEYEGTYILHAKLLGIDGFCTTKTVTLSYVKNHSTTRIISYVNGKRARVKIIRSELPMLKECSSFLNRISMDIIMDGIDE